MLAVHSELWHALVNLASPPDALRLVALPVFAWAAWRDVKTRRVPNVAWLPLLAVGLVALAWEGWRVATGAALADPTVYALRVAGGIAFIVVLAYLLWAIGGFGGADAKALMVLAVVFPTYPAYLLPWTALPLKATTVGVFALTILSNTVVVGLLYPLSLVARNLAGKHSGDWRAMALGLPVHWQDLLDTHGRVLETPESTFDNTLDTSVVQQYCRWRATAVDTLRADPERYRDPASLPEGVAVSEDGNDRPEGNDRPDDWGAEAFYATTDATGSPEKLRDALEVISERETVWVMPGIPFVVPMFLGLLVSVVYGDVLFAIIAVLSELAGVA